MTYIWKDLSSSESEWYEVREGPYIAAVIDHVLCGIWLVEVYDRSKSRYLFQAEVRGSLLQAKEQAERILETLMGADDYE